MLANMHRRSGRLFDIIKALPGTRMFTTMEELDRYLDSMQRKITGG